MVVAPEVVFPMRSAESHGATNGGGSIDRKTGGGVGTAAGSVGSGGSGSMAIGQSLFYTDFPPKEYGHSGKLRG